MKASFRFYHLANVIIKSTTMSLITQFNQPDEIPLHSSGMAGGTEAPKPQSFTERMKLDRQRKVIKGYRFSMQGSGMREPSLMKNPEPRSESDASATDSTMSRRQAFNAGESTPPQAPPSKYNPYE